MTCQLQWKSYWTTYQKTLFVTRKALLDRSCEMKMIMYGGICKGKTALQRHWAIIWGNIWYICSTWLPIQNKVGLQLLYDAFGYIPETQIRYQDRNEKMSYQTCLKGAYQHCAEVKNLIKYCWAIQSLRVKRCPVEIHQVARLDVVWRKRKGR